MDPIDKLEVENALKNLICLLPHYAQAMSAYRESLIEHGFTRPEAIDIIKAHGYAPPSPGITGGGNNND